MKKGENRHRLLPFPFEIWSGRRVSNSRPQPWQGCALPTELLPQLRRRIIRGFLELSRARNQKVYFFASLSPPARTPRTYQPTDQRLSPCGSCNPRTAPRSRRCALPQSTSNGICTADASRDGRQRKCRRDTSIRTFERRAGRHQAAKNKSPRSEDRGLAIDSHDRSQRPIDASSLVR